MDEKPNYGELEKRIDFTVLAERIGQLTPADNPQRKTVFTLLDKVREPILTARRNRQISYQVLAKELSRAGIPVSEPTLRKYIRAHGGAAKPRKQGRALAVSAAKTPEPSANETKTSTPPVPTEKTPPATPPEQHRFKLGV